jgi:hypothetical protein
MRNKLILGVAPTMLAVGVGGAGAGHVTVIDPNAEPPGYLAAHDDVAGIEIDSFARVVKHGHADATIRHFVFGPNVATGWHTHPGAGDRDGRERHVLVSGRARERVPNEDVHDRTGILRSRLRSRPPRNRRTERSASLHAVAHADGNRERDDPGGCRPGVFINSGRREGHDPSRPLNSPSATGGDQRRRNAGGTVIESIPRSPAPALRSQRQPHPDSVEVTR